MKDPLSSSPKPAEFDEFWSEYPRKRCKLAAQKAYLKARKLVSAADILAGLRHYEFSPDVCWQPHPATWLNGGGWMVEADTAPPTVIVSKPESELAAFERALGIGQDDVVVVVPTQQSRLL